MSLPAAAETALHSFSQPISWEQRARLLMAWGEQLEALSAEERSEGNQVSGCESQVWLVGEQHNGRWQFRAASDARLIRGLLALLLVRVNGLAPDALKAIDLVDWFTRLGLARHLSPSRSNGLQAVLRRMAEMANA